MGEEGKGEATTSWLERFQRSARFAILVILVFVGIELIIAWDDYATRTVEIRRALKEKTSHYLAILAEAGRRPVMEYDWDRLDQFARHVLKDADAVYVRFTDGRGNVIYDRVETEWEQRFREKAGGRARNVLREVFERAVGRACFSPEEEIPLAPEELPEEDWVDRYHAFSTSVVKFGAEIAAALGFESEEKPEVEIGVPVLYRDRVERAGRVDRSLAIGATPIEDRRNNRWGAVLLGISQDRIQEEIDAYFRSTLVITIFFIVLVVVQEILAWIEQRRVRRMEEEIASGRRMLSTLLPDLPDVEGVTFGLVLCQAEPIGGGYYDARLRSTEEFDLLVANSSAAGVVGSYSIAMLESLCRALLSDADPSREPGWLVRMLTEDFINVGIPHPVQLVHARVRLGDEPRVWFAMAGAEPPLVLRDGDLLPESESFGAPVQAEEEKNELALEERDLKAGDTLLFYNDGLAPEARAFDRDALRALFRKKGDQEPQALADEVTRVVLEANDEELRDDLVVIVVRLDPPK